MASNAGPRHRHRACRPQPHPPECQAELRQLTDRVREERDRAQTLCTASVVDTCSTNYTLVPIASYMDHIKDFPYTSSSLVKGSMVKEIMTHHMCTVQLCLQPS